MRLTVRLRLRDIATDSTDSKVARYAPVVVRLGKIINRCCHDVLLLRRRADSSLSINSTDSWRPSTCPSTRLPGER
jgi:hypothetical protein